MMGSCRHAREVAERLAIETYDVWQSQRRLIAVCSVGGNADKGTDKSGGTGSWSKKR
jgi:hypothetical protein